MATLPPGPVIWTTIRSTLLSWVVLRAFAGFAGGGLSMALGASVLLILGVATIAVLDVAVARERLFLGNLGVGRRVIAGISLAVACALEIIAVLALPVLLPGVT